MEKIIFWLQYAFDLKGLRVSLYTLHSISIDDPTKMMPVQK